MRLLEQRALFREESCRPCRSGWARWPDGMIVDRGSVAYDFPQAVSFVAVEVTLSGDLFNMLIHLLSFRLQLL
jgi:hypothetical protein